MAVVYGRPLFTTGLAIVNMEPLERKGIDCGRQRLASRFDFLIVIVRRCRNGELRIICLDFQRPVQVIVNIAKGNLVQSSGQNVH